MLCAAGNCRVKTAVNPTWTYLVKEQPGGKIAGHKVIRTPEAAGSKNGRVLPLPGGVSPPATLNATRANVR